MSLPPALAALAAAQAGAFTRQQALMAGLHPRAVAAHRRAGRWVVVRRGIYAERVVVDALTAHGLHALECSARRLALAGDLVVSDESAAVLHGIPLLHAVTGQPRLTLARSADDGPSHVHDLYAAAVPAAHRTAYRGVPVTTGARTVADCARTLPRDAALVMADGALRAGVNRVAVLQLLRRDCAGWPRVQRAVDVVMCASALAESALESLARGWFAEGGLPAPELQVRLCQSADGVFVARVDFAWLRLRTVCEVDGRVKYDDPRALWREKLREDHVRELGLEVVRGYWSDGADGGRCLVERLRRAFARGAARADPPSYGLLVAR
jgi:hypothetical protein